MSITPTTHLRYFANFIDICPKHAGYLLGISNTIATVPGIVGNIVTGSKTLPSFHPPAHFSVKLGYVLGFEAPWRIVFSMVVMFYVVGLLVFLTWARGSVQFR